jgi:hypothetical protein
MVLHSPPTTLLNSKSTVPHSQSTVLHSQPTVLHNSQLMVLHHSQPTTAIKRRSKSVAMNPPFSRNPVPRRAKKMEEELTFIKTRCNTSSSLHRNKSFQKRRRRKKKTVDGVDVNAMIGGSVVVVVVIVGGGDMQLL